MSTLGQGQKPILMPSYPHMMALDTEVWSKYLADPLEPIMSVWYDVHVGQAVKLGGEADGMDVRIALGLTRKRIDVIAQLANVIWVIEVKPVASMTALGQVLTYKRLFTQEYRPLVPTIGVCVCGVADEDLIADFEAVGAMVIGVE